MAHKCSISFGKESVDARYMSDMAIGCGGSLRPGGYRHCNTNVASLFRGSRIRDERGHDLLTETSAWITLLTQTEAIHISSLTDMLYKSIDTSTRVVDYVR